MCLEDRRREKRKVKTTGKTEWDRRDRGGEVWGGESLSHPVIRHDLSLSD